MSDKRIVNVQLTNAKSVAAVEIGKNEYVDADGVTYKNIDSDLISNADDISEEEKMLSNLCRHCITILQNWKSRSVQLMQRSVQLMQKLQLQKKTLKKQNLSSENCRGECQSLILLKRSETCCRQDCITNGRQRILV